MDLVLTLFNMPKMLQTQSETKQKILFLACTKPIFARNWRPTMAKRQGRWRRQGSLVGERAVVQQAVGAYCEGAILLLHNM